MAAKRVATSSVNWAKLSDRLTTEHAAELTKLKTHYTTFYSQINELPADLPKFNFAELKKKMPEHSATLDSLQKQYEAVSIPYGNVPEQFSKEIDQWLKYNEERIRFQDSKKKEGEKMAKKVDDKWKRAPPIEQMNNEQILEFFPDKVSDFRFEKRFPKYACSQTEAYPYPLYGNYRIMSRPGSDPQWHGDH